MARPTAGGAVRGGLLSHFRSSAVDWVVLFALIGAFIGINVNKPFVRFVDEEHLKALMYPLRSNTVPSLVVPIVALLVPIIIFLLFQLSGEHVYDLHQASLGILYSIFATAIMTDGLKVLVGRPRPDFFWRCFPDSRQIFDARGNVICSGTASVVWEGRKSFPSGHSSWSFAGLVFLTYYLSGKLAVFRGRGHVHRTVLALAPLFCAIAIAATRIHDYWHNPTDVLTGAVFGTTSATLFYFQLYPPLNSESCSKALEAQARIASPVSRSTQSESPV